MVVLNLHLDMKIGILAYNSACNFGATLQLLSTFRYLKNNGYDPIVINWVPEDLQKFYADRTVEVQFQMQQRLRQSIWKETALCRSSYEVAQIITKEAIDAVIIGSDAVAQHHTIRERISFPTRRVFSISKVTSDRLFPNSFWGDFEKYLPTPIPLAFLSASSQDSVYKFYSNSLKKNMAEALTHFTYISVRDVWTRDLISYVTNGRITPLVTPDPVFAFNYNAADMIPPKEDILRKFGLPDKYFVLSFEPKRGIKQEWIDEFISLSHNNGIECIGLPFSIRDTIGAFPHRIAFPLTPLEWYSLIKYSQGYIGNNMHPIVVSLHNANPFYSFDNYGMSSFRGRKTSDKSSKIKHILELSGFGDYRVSCLPNKYEIPSPQEIFDKISLFDREKASQFVSRYYGLYKETMVSILNSFK